MLRRIWTSAVRDTKVTFRNHYYTVTIAFALFYLALIIWVIPSEATVKHATYLLDQTVDGRVAAAALQQNEEGRLHLVSSVEEMRTALQKNRNAVGVAIAEGEPLPAATLFFQGHENPRLRALLAVSTEEWLRQIEGEARPAPVAIETVALRGESPPAKVDLNRSLVPLFLFSDAAMLGLMLIAALIFFEKEEGTLRAYLVTPGRIWEYLLAKALALALVALAFTAVLVPPILGTGPNYLYLAGLMALGAVMTALLGALIAVWFENLTQFLFPAIGIVSAISLPAGAYFVPSFSPLWLRYLPTYPMIFGLREASFPSGSPEVVHNAMLILLAANLVLLLLASLAFRRRLAYS
ncbi:MAG: ABC transporter permease [Bacillota bacterium]